MPTLLIRYPDGSEYEQELSTEITIGRAGGNDLILPEGGVSRRHARIFVQNGRLVDRYHLDMIVRLIGLQHIHGKHVGIGIEAEFGIVGEKFVPEGVRLGQELQ